MTSQSVSRPPHPGEILCKELEELGITREDFDAALALPSGATAALLDQRGGVNAELALRLGRYFGTTPRFWMDLQNAYDLKIAELQHRSAVAAQITPRVSPDDIPDWAGGDKATGESASLPLTP